MARYWVSGANAEEFAVSSTGLTNLMGATITSGRVLWLTSVVVPTVTLSNPSAEIFICDAATSLDFGAAASATAVKKFAFQPFCPSEGVPKDTLIEFPMPGMKFSTGCGIHTNASEPFAIGRVCGAGYEV